MTLPMRLVVLLLCWVAAAAAGWWWHRPSPVAQRTAQAATPSAPDVSPDGAPTAQTIARRVAALDPMGLSRAPSVTPAGPGSVTPAAESIVWRVAALVVRGPERYAVLTATDQNPLRVGVGERLPDGDRIKSIHADRIEIQSPRGRRRTLYLIEP